MNVLVTGGAGYIGSHACLTFIKAGFEVIVVDNLSNSSIHSIQRIEKLTNKKIKFYQLNICQTYELDKIFKTENILSRQSIMAGVASQLSSP